MPHHIDFDSIHFELFLILNLTYASPIYSLKHNVSFMPDSENKDQFYYSSWLRYTLSEKLLIVTTKIRTIMDILIEDQRFFQENGEEPYIEISKIEKSVSEGRKIGKYLEGNGPCTIRDCCNRIIHASTIHPNISYAKDAYDKLFSFNKNLKCWNGMLFLYGEKNGKNWKFELSVADFCIVLESFLSKIETEIDWHRLFKYDDIE